MQLPNTVLDENCDRRLNLLVNVRSQLLPMLAHFANCKQIAKSVFHQDDQLSVVESDRSDRVELLYAGTRIRFSLVVGLRGEDVVSKIVCTHVVDTFGKEQSFALGEFSVDDRGRTNYGESSGRPHYTKESADLIVAFYLSKAFENNLRIEPESSRGGE